MAKNITDKHFSTASKNVHENIPDNHYNPYFKVKSNPNDTHFKHKYRNNRYNKNVDVEGPFRMYHQNIRGLKGKINQLGVSFLDVAPHIICLTEHHLKDHEIDITHIPSYELGAKYCGLNFKNGGVFIFLTH
jgi:hypothetical protein